jgi:hypothetical protein
MLEIVNAIAVLLGGVLAISGLIIAKKPDAKALIDKLSPYQALIGVAMVLLGIINFLRVLPWLKNVFQVNLLLAAAILSMLAVSVVLGALFGMPQITKWIPGDSPAEQKALELAQKVAPFQVLLGLIGIAASVVFLLYRLNIIHWTA